MKKTLVDYFKDNDPKDPPLAIRWDAHKAIVRGVLINLASQAKREQIRNVSTITEELHLLSTQHKQNPTPAALHRINLLGTDLTQIMSDKASFALTRTKQRYFKDANKPRTMLACKSRGYNAVHAMPCETQRGTSREIRSR